MLISLVHCHIAKSPVPPHELNAAIPQPVSDIILRLMAKNAEDRYQSAWGIKADLELCADQLEVSSQIDRIRLGLQDVSDQFQIPLWQLPTNGTMGDRCYRVCKYCSR